MGIQDIRAECDALRKSDLRLFAVANREWYSLFRDEIRNISIEKSYIKGDLTLIYRLVLTRLQSAQSAWHGKTRSTRIPYLTA